MKYNLVSDCCNYKARYYYGNLTCIKCKRKCVLQRLYTSNKVRKEFAKKNNGDIINKTI